MTLEVTTGPAGEERWLVVDLPTEESMESFASRCRPFVLEGDTVHYATVLNALGYFARTDPELTQGLASQREAWANLRRDHPEPLGYASRVGQAKVEGFSDLITDRELAYRWLYGDLVHADDLRSMEHDLTERYEAGVLLTTNIAFRVIILLNILRIACQRNLVDLSAAAFTQDISATTYRRMQVSAMATGAVGTTSDLLEAVLDAHHAHRPPDTPT